MKGAESEYRTRYARYLSGNKVLYGRVTGVEGQAHTAQGEPARRRAIGPGPQTTSDVLFDFDREFKVQSDVVYVPIIKGNSSERIGYPTQKPLELLRKIIESSTNEGDMVLDPFAGGATACVAAEQLGREWAGIDVSPLAAKVVVQRLGGHLGPKSHFAHRHDVPERTDLAQGPGASSTTCKSA